MRLGAQMASAMAHAHAHGVLHCDLKPGNVFVTRAGAIKVVDFGLARPTADDGQGEAEIGASPTLVKNRAGTPAYMSPEHLLGIALDERADVFSLGVILSEMATGRRPEALPAAWLDSSDGTTRELPVVGPDVPELLRSVLMRALAPRPQMRYQTALELQDALERVAAHNPPASIVGSADADATWKRRADVRPRPPRPRPAVTALVKPAAWVLGAAGVILVLGVINSAVLNVTLGRSGFVTEGIGDWFHWGLKSVVAPGALAAMLVILFEFARTVWRFVCRRWMPGVPSSITRALGRVGFEDPAFSARTLAGAGLVALGAVVWQFNGFLGALVSPDGINGGELSRFAVLGSDHLDVHRQYRVTLTIVVVGLAVGLYGVLQRRRRLGAHDDRSTMFAAAAVFGLALAMLDLPYRVVHPTGSQFELAQLGSRSCYIIAERSDDFLVSARRRRSRETGLSGAARQTSYDSAVSAACSIRLAPVDGNVRLAQERDRMTRSAARLVLVALLVLTVCPGRADASGWVIWDWLDQLSGPGPFEGQSVQIPVACAFGPGGGAEDHSIIVGLECLLPWKLTAGALGAKRRYEPPNSLRHRVRGRRQPAPPRNDDGTATSTWPMRPAITSRPAGVRPSVAY